MGVGRERLRESVHGDGFSPFTTKTSSSQGHAAFAERIPKQVQVRWPPFPQSTKGGASFRGDGWEPQAYGPGGRDPDFGVRQVCSKSLLYHVLATSPSPSLAARCDHVSVPRCPHTLGTMIVSRAY